MIEIAPNDSKLKSCDASKERRKLRRLQGLGCRASGCGFCFTCPVNTFSRNLGGAGGTESSRRQVMRPPDIRCIPAQDADAPPAGLDSTGVPRS